MKIIICNLEQYRDAIGIHLKQPDAWYLNDAIETAFKDLVNRLATETALRSDIEKSMLDALNVIQKARGEV